MNILLLNAHSPQNAGDLAILQESLACLREAYPRSEITVTINDDRGSLPPDATFIPSLTRWLVSLDDNGDWHWHKSLAVPYTALLLVWALCYRWFALRLYPRQSNRRRLIEAYYNADLIAVIGGGHLYARHSLNIAFLWLWVGLAFAILLRKPLIFLPQSFGPLPGRLQRGLLAWLLNRSQLIVAREYRSLAFLAEIGVKQQVLVLPDLAFLQANSTHYALPVDVQQRPLIGLTLMDWGRQNAHFQNQRGYEQAIIALILHVRQQYNANILLFAQCTGPTLEQDDRHIARRIIAALPDPTRVTLVDAVLSPTELQYAYSQLDMLVATRMHSAIFALNNAIPVLVIGYLHKSVGLMEVLGLPQAVLDINEVDAVNICDTFDQVWGSHSSIHDQLIERIPAVRTTLAQLPNLIREKVVLS